jgi:hypothetical protein
MWSVAAPRGVAIAASAAFAVAALGATSLIVLRPESAVGTFAGLFLCLVAAFAVVHRALLSWRAVLGTIVLILLLVPIRVYELPSALPFNVELYRLVLFAALIVWAGALLVDPKVRLGRSFMSPAIGTITLAYLASAVACGRRLDQPYLGSAAVKALALFATIVLFYCMILSITRTFADAETIVSVLVAGGAVVAFFSLIEARTGFNAFNHLNRVLPFLTRAGGLSGADLTRSGHLRVFASTEHPIELSALLVMLVPLAAYLAERTRRRRWWLAAGLLLAASLATLSRTGIVMLIVVAVVFLWLRPAAMKALVRRSWRFSLPLLVAIHFLLPGTIGTIHDLFFPSQGLVAEQATGGVGSSRVASLGPGLHVVNEHFVFGLGYGTRIANSSDPHRNSFIVDDGWLSTAMESGVTAVVIWLWIFLRFIRRTGAEARRDSSERGRLLAAFSASVAAYAVGMATYDAESFLQVTFVLFIILALGGAVASMKPTADHKDVRVPAT